LYGKTHEFSDKGSQKYLFLAEFLTVTQILFSCCLYKCVLLCPVRAFEPVGYLQPIFSEDTEKGKELASYKLCEKGGWVKEK